MIFKSIKAYPSHLLIHVDAALSIKILSTPIDIKKNNFFNIEKSKFTTSVLKPLQIYNVNIEKLFEDSFIHLSNQYLIDPCEFDGWLFLFNKITNPSVKLFCARYFVSTFTRCIIHTPELQSDIDNLLKKIIFLAKKHNDKNLIEVLNKQFPYFT